MILIARRLQWLGWFLAGILATLLLSSNTLSEQSVTSASSNINQSATYLPQHPQLIQAVQAAEPGVQINAGC